MARQWVDHLAKKVIAPHLDSQTDTFLREEEATCSRSNHVVSVHHDLALWQDGVAIDHSEVLEDIESTDHPGIYGLVDHSASTSLDNQRDDPVQRGLSRDRRGIDRLLLPPDHAGSERL